MHHLHGVCRYLAMTSIDEANGWYGGTLLAEQDETSEVYRHYAQFCQVNISFTFLLPHCNFFVIKLFFTY